MLGTRAKEPTAAATAVGAVVVLVLGFGALAVPVDGGDDPSSAAATDEVAGSGDDAPPVTGEPDVVGAADQVLVAPNDAADLAEDAAAEQAAGATPPSEPALTSQGGEPVPPARDLPREVVATAATLMGLVAGIDLVHPSAAVERIGYHESSHEGAQPQQAYDTAARPIILPSRGRGTGPTTAADVVAAPDQPIVAPVTGTVIRAGTYTLYCEHTDAYVVIAPDVRPDWEVKLLHVTDLAVATGDRVVAGSTVLAAGPRLLPFDSQVDEWTADPSWPHVHLEVVDPSIPNVPTPGGGCP